MGVTGGRRGCFSGEFSGVEAVSELVLGLGNGS